MDHDEKKETGADPMFSAWMKSAMDFWQNMAETSEAFATPEQSKKSGFKQTRQSFQTSTKVMQSIMAMLLEPENMGAFFKGADTVPEFMMTMAQQTVDGFMEMQKKLSERMARMGTQTQAYNFDDLDRDFFKYLKDFYEREFQKFFNVPQLGLTRFYQERVNRVADKYNLFQTALSEFIYMFYVPIEKSYGVMQEKVDELVEKGEFHENFKDYYNMWVKILEGHYMTLLQSQEYTRVLDNTIDALADYRSAREEMLYDMLKQLPIPTNKEMDELYKDLYLLKKQVRELSRKVAQNIEKQ